MSVTEKTLFTPKDVVQITTVVLTVALSYFAQMYNMNVKFNEFSASLEKVYIYVEELKKDNESFDMRLNTTELGLRKNELDIARYLNNR